MILALSIGALVVGVVGLVVPALIAHATRPRFHDRHCWDCAGNALAIYHRTGPAQRAAIRRQQKHMKEDPDHG